MSDGITEIIKKMNGQMTEAMATIKAAEAEILSLRATQGELVEALEGVFTPSLIETAHSVTNCDLTLHVEAQKIRDVGALLERIKQ